MISIGEDSVATEHVPPENETLHQGGLHAQGELREKKEPLRT